MAKSKSILDLHGTHAGITHVDSRAYGKHVRAARGTYKPAMMNKECEAASERLITSNTPAKLLNDALKPYKGDLEKGDFWQRLVKLFQKQYKQTGQFDFASIPSIEVRDDHRFEAIVTAHFDITADKAARTLTAAIRLQGRPHFRRASYIDGYRLGLIVIFPDLPKLKAPSEATYTDVIPLKSKERHIQLTVPIPRRSKDFVVCLRVEGCEKGEVNEQAKTTGMRIVMSGRLDHMEANRSQKK